MTPFDLVISNIVEFLQNPNNKNSLLLIATIVVTFITFRKDKSFDIKRERFEKLISPLYYRLEPYMYREIDAGSLNNIIDFIEKNRLYADANLIERATNCKACPTPYNFEQLCRCVDVLFDKYSRATSLKIRSINYRLTKRLYKNKLTLLIYLLIASFQSIRVPVIFYIAFFIFTFLPSDKVEKFLHIGLGIFALALLTSLIWIICDFFKSRRRTSEYSKLF